MDSAFTPTTHCDTCLCSSNTVPGALTARIRRLYSTGRIVKPSLSPDLTSLMRATHWLYPSMSPLFQFGFDDFIPSVETEILVARIRCAVIGKDGLRFFALTVDGPQCVPHIHTTPHEHARGGVFKIDQCHMDREGIAVAMSMSDRQLAWWVYSHTKLLAQFIEETYRKERDEERGR